MEALLSAIAFAIPCAKKAVPTIIALTVITAIIQSIRNRRIQLPAALLPNLFSIGLFLLLLLGLTYSKLPQEGLSEIGIKLSFLVFPLLAFLLPAMRIEQYNRYAQAFVTGCLTYVVITLCRAIAISIEANDAYYMTYESLSWYIHPTYAATYLALAVYLLFYLSRCGELITGNRRLHFATAALLLVHIALLSSKAGLLALMLVVPAAAMELKKNGWTYRKYAVFITIGLALPASITYLMPATATRISIAVSEIKEQTSPSSLEEKGISYSSTQLRMVTWTAAWQIFKENPFGTGTGATAHYLDNIYEQMGEVYAAERHLNAHNQYLQTAAEIGWPGLLLLCAAMWSLWKIDHNTLGYTAKIFIALCAMNFLFESFLEVQAGIVFYCFWILLITKINRDSSQS